MFNRLTDMARSGARLTPTLLVGFLSVVFFLVPAILGGSLVGPALIAPRFGAEAAINASALRSGFVFTLTELVAYALAIALVWLWLRAYEGRPLATVGLGRDGAAKKFAFGAAIGFGAFTIWFLIAATTGAAIPETSPPQLVGVRALGGVLVASVGVLIAAAAEEVIFRGWALPVIAARLGPALGVILSAALFALPHVLNDDATPLMMVNIGLYGAVLALWALLQGSLWGVIGFHWLWNLAQFNLYGFDVTPSETLGGALVNFAYTANVPFVTAGAVAEDSLLLTLSLLVAVAGFYLRLERKIVSSVRA